MKESEKGGSDKVTWQKGEAIWKQIEKILLTEIVNGTFKMGEKLPTEDCPCP